MFLHGHHGQCVSNHIIPDRRIFCIRGKACEHADARGASGRKRVSACLQAVCRLYQLSKNDASPPSEKKPFYIIPHCGEYDIIHASETEQHHAHTLHNPVRRFRRAACKQKVAARACMSRTAIRLLERCGGTPHGDLALRRGVRRPLRRGGRLRLQLKKRSRLRPPHQGRRVRVRLRRGFFLRPHWQPHSDNQLHRDRVCHRLRVHREQPEPVHVAHRSRRRGGSRLCGC